MMPVGSKLDLDSQIQQRMHKEAVIGFYKPQVKDSWSSVEAEMTIAELREAYHRRVCREIIRISERGTEKMSDVS